MPLTLAAALVTASIQPACSWDQPGQNPYRGKVREALERYTDIPPADRIALQHRISEGQADDQVQITRDAIVGKHDYAPTIRDMHFGAASLCHTVTRARWAPARKEPGAVYCVKEHCILIPKICGNVSRIERHVAPAVAQQAAPPSYRARSQLGDALPGMDLGLADADLVEPDPAELDEARERSRQALERLALLPTASPGDDDRNRQAGHYTPTTRPGDGDDDFPFWPFDPAPPYEPGPGGALIPSPVPEADSWSMLLAGLALLGLVARRQRRR